MITPMLAWVALWCAVFATSTRVIPLTVPVIILALLEVLRAMGWLSR